jgi:hypothetical protein
MLDAADLWLLLSRQALGDYSVACEAAQIAAERCGATTNPSPDTLEQLRTCRGRVVAAEEMLAVVGDDLATPAAWIASRHGPHRDVVVRLVGTVLDRLCGGLESSEDEIVAAARHVQHLRAWLDELGPPRPGLHAPDNDRGDADRRPRR